MFPDLNDALVIILPMIFGAIVLAVLAVRMKQSPLIGMIIGAIAGAVGSMFFMVPLDYCTFEPGRDPIDIQMGSLLISVGTIGALAIAHYLMKLTYSGRGWRSLTEGQSTSGTFRGRLAPWIFLTPSLIILAVFLYYPAIDTFRLSTRLTLLGASRTRFECVDNFTRLLDASGINWGTFAFILLTIGVFYIYRYVNSTLLNQLNLEDSLLGTLIRYAIIAVTLYLIFNVIMSRVLESGYYNVMLSTFTIAFATVVFGLSISLMIAYMAFQPIRGASIYRTLLIWPYAISPPVAGIIFFIIFNPSAGIINHFIESLGGEGLPWLQSSSLAPWTIIIASVWKQLGFNILFYIAGLQNVPKDLTEAAAIDGANAFVRFTNIIVPSLSPITFFLIITNITYAFFDVFGTIDYLTKGGPAGATSVMIYEIYKTGIQQSDLGKAAAQSVVLFVLVIGITIVQFRTTGRRVNYGA